jgi:hypothetical protein
MELSGHPSRPIGMRYAPLIAAGVLAAALAGCGSAVSGSTAASGAGNSTASTATGCADASLATKVTIDRSLRMVEPTKLGALSQTQTDPAKVRALFRDFCQVLSHRQSVTGRAIPCPNAFGLGYTGTFYAGNQVLASYAYTASGCQAVTVTAAGKSQSALVFGSAAKAAPDLEPDMARALGLTVQQAFQPYGGIHVYPGGNVAVGVGGMNS